MNDKAAADRQFVCDMLHYAQRAHKRTIGITRKDLEADDDLIGAALIYDIFVIGEAANHVSAEFQARFPAVPWRQIIGLRNILGHEYSNIDYDILWVIATENVPKLIDQLEALLAE